MKRMILIGIAFLIGMAVIAQTPLFFKYQAVARDLSGNILANQNVTFRINILKSGATGTLVYSETHQKTTNAFGLVDLEIGNGTLVSGSIGGIDWGKDKYFVSVEMDPSGGTAFQAMGTNQLLSVPYALYARNVENNNDGDTDSTNEIQKLSINGSVLSLSRNGGSVTLPSSTVGDNWGTQTVVTDSTLSGTGTVASQLKIAQQGATAGQVLKWNGSGWSPANDVTGTGGFALPYTGTANTSGSALNITNSSSSDYSNAVYGFASSGTNLTYGVKGTSASSNGTGVFGEASALTGINTGVYGYSASSSGRGVLGFADAATGSTTGVLGRSISTEGQGIWGKAEATTGSNYGVVGSSASSEGYGVFGIASNTTGYNYGVYGSSGSSSGTGVLGIVGNATGTTYGVRGLVESVNGFSGYFTGGKFYVGGNAGFGTENPGSKLEVAGQIKITGGNPGAGKVLTSDANGLGSWVVPGGMLLPFYGTTTTDTAVFKIVNKSADGTETASGLYGSSTGASGTGVFGSAPALTGTGKGIWGDVGSSDAYSGYFTGGRFYVNGNTGIGIKSPTCKLDVVGNRIRLSNTSGSYIALRTDETTGFVNLYYSCANLIIQGSAPGENILMLPTSNSRIGIKTWTPIYDLDVSGDIRATGNVYYGGTGGSSGDGSYTKPDNVFEKKYKVMQTDEVEKFISRENHLPWVTSAKQEKAENGDVTNMTRLSFETLESVENLELQIIEQQKLIKDLAGQNEQLTSENEQLKNQNEQINTRLSKLEKMISNMQKQ